MEPSDLAAGARRQLQDDNSLETEYTARPTNKPTAPDSFTHSGAGWLTKAQAAFRRMPAMTGVRVAGQADERLCP